MILSFVIFWFKHKSRPALKNGIACRFTCLFSTICGLISVIQGATLSQSTCEYFFTVLRRLENYKKIVVEVNYLRFLQDVFILAEKLIVLNYKVG